MTATFVVEDGTGLSTANAYVAEAAATQYHENNGNPTAWAGASSSARQAAIRLATRYLDAKYHGRWKGVRANETQVLDWPRSDAYDRDGYLLDDDAIPQCVADACAVLALQQLGGDDLLGTVSTGTNIASETNKIGDLSQSVTYIGGKSQHKRYPLVEGILAPVIFGHGEIVRA